METFLRRFAIAALCGFGVFVFALPLGCGGLMLYSEHLNGDVQSGGPAALLGGMAMAAVLGTLVFVVVLVKSRKRD